MDQQIITSRTFSPPPPPLKKWCDRWNKAARKADVMDIKMAARTVGRPNGLRPVYHLSLVRIGREPLTCSFKGRKLEDLTDEVLWSATTGLMTAAEIKAKIKIV